MKQTLLPFSVLLLLLLSLMAGCQSPADEDSTFSLPAFQMGDRFWFEWQPGGMNESVSMVVQEGLERTIRDHTGQTVTNHVRFSVPDGVFAFQQEDPMVGDRPKSLVVSTDTAQYLQLNMDDGELGSRIVYAQPGLRALNDAVFLLALPMTGQSWTVGDRLQMDRFGFLWNVEVAASDPPTLKFVSQHNSTSALRIPGDEQTTEIIQRYTLKFHEDVPTPSEIWSALTVPGLDFGPERQVFQLKDFDSGNGSDVKFGTGAFPQAPLRDLVSWDDRLPEGEPFVENGLGKAADEVEATQEFRDFDSAHAPYVMTDVDYMRNEGSQEWTLGYLAEDGERFEGTVRYTNPQLTDESPRQVQEMVSGVLDLIGPEVTTHQDSGDPNPLFDARPERLAVVSDAIESALERYASDKGVEGHATFLVFRTDFSYSKQPDPGDERVYESAYFVTAIVRPAAQVLGDAPESRTYLVSLVTNSVLREQGPVPT